MLFALLVHYVSTQDSLFWSHCSKNSNWQRANPHYNAIKSWLKSIHFNQEKSPAYPWKITKVNQSKKGEEAEELIHTIAKFQDGKWKGWKLTSTQETMALELNGYFYGTMDESMQMNGKFWRDIDHFESFDT